jgi:hypothetical protein
VLRETGGEGRDTKRVLAYVLACVEMLGAVRENWTKGLGVDDSNQGTRYKQSKGGWDGGGEKRTRGPLQAKHVENGKHKGKRMQSRRSLPGEGGG